MYGHDGLSSRTLHPRRVERPSGRKNNLTKQPTGSPDLVPNLSGFSAGLCISTCQSDWRSEVGGRSEPWLVGVVLPITVGLSGPS
jgi:hypothetical protein